MAKPKRDQPGDFGGGFVHGTTYATMEEATAAAAKYDELEEFLLSMTPVQRSEWFALNSDADGNVQIEELS